MEQLIKVDKLTKQYSDVVALEKVSFTIKKGEIFGFLGPSGSGKTTTIKILTGQLLPTSGEANVFNTNVKEFNKNMYKEIGIMTDNSALYARLSIFDNLNIFAKIHGVNSEQTIDLLKKVGLYEKREIPAKNISKGMKQRLTLARAVINKPKILFLDEPTSDLDPTTTLQIHKILKELKSNGTAIFMATHDMTEANKLCDNIALLYKGEIIEYGSPQKIIQKYTSSKRYLVHTKDNHVLNIEDTSEGNKQISQLYEKDLIESIHSEEPTLEEIFIKLTKENSK